MALNAIDGMMAREHNMKSDLGMILNEVGDVLADSALYLPFAFVFTEHAQPALIVTIVMLSIVSEMTGVVAVQINGERRYDGPLGKSDRAFLFGVLSLAVGCGVQVGEWLTYGLGFATF